MDCTRSHTSVTQCVQTAAYALISSQNILPDGVPSCAANKICDGKMKQYNKIQQFSHIRTEKYIFFHIQEKETQTLLPTVNYI